MTLAKRITDVALALLLLALLWPLILLVALLIFVRDGAPVFYVSERMKSPDQAFDFWKFRTMRSCDQNVGVAGGDKAARITPLGQFLRRTRLDELPQLWNVLRGDISFVGPRAPLRRYVEMFPEVYGEVLLSRPGVTGLATLAFHAREEALLAPCKTPEESEDVYIRRCVPVKARIDLIYAQNRSFCYDLRLMVATVLRRIPLRQRN